MKIVRGGIRRLNICASLTKKFLHACVKAGRVSQGMLWVQAATLGYKVKLLLNGQEIPTTQTLPHRFEVGPFEAGRHLLTFKVLSDTNILLFQEHWPFMVRR